MKSLTQHFFSRPSTGGPQLKNLTTWILLLCLIFSFPLTVAAKGKQPGGGGGVHAIGSIPVGASPFGMAFNPQSGQVYVANVGSDSISVIDTTLNGVVGIIQLPADGSCSHPYGLGYNDRNARLFVSCQSYSAMAVIDGASNTLLSTFTVGSSPMGMALHPRSGNFYVAQAGSGEVWVINSSTNQVVSVVKLPAAASAPLGSSPIEGAYNSRNNRFYFTNPGSNSVSIINASTNKVEGSISVGNTPRGIAYDPRNSHVYVANYGSDTVSVIEPSSRRVVATIPVRSAPIAVAYVQSYIYVSNFGSSLVSVIDDRTNTVVAEVPVGNGPGQLVYNPANGYVYVATVYTNEVWIISTTP